MADGQGRPLRWPSADPPAPGRPGVDTTEPMNISTHPWTCQDDLNFEQWMLTPTAEQRAELDAWYHLTPAASGRQFDPDKYRPYCAGRSTAACLWISSTASTTATASSRTGPTSPGA
jgi:hypothetical protein